MDERNSPPTTMPMIVPTSDFLGVEVKVGTGAPDGVVLIEPVGVGVPVDSGAAGAGVSVWEEDGCGRTCVSFGCGEVDMVQPHYC